MQIVKKKLCLLVILTLTVFSGCSQKEPEVVYLKSTCVTPEVDCDFRGESIDDVLSKYIECIIELKKANGVCKWKLAKME